MEIIGRKVMKIKAIPGELEYAKGTKMEGQKYRRFGFSDTDLKLDGVFIANVNDDFCRDYESKILYSVEIKCDDEGKLSLMNHTTIQQEVNMKKTEAILSAFTAENYIAGKLTNVEALEGAVV